MIVDHITHIADALGVPTSGKCEPTRSRACLILERIETLFLIDYCVADTPQLGARWRTLLERIPA